MELHVMCLHSVSRLLSGSVPITALRVAQGGLEDTWRRKRRPIQYAH